MSHFLHELEVTHCKEPFAQFLPVGLVMAETFQVKSTGQFVSAGQVQQTSSSDMDKVDKNGKCKTKFVWKKSSDDAEWLEVEKSWQKMSKSKYNGVEPAEVISRHSLETVRLAILSNSGPDKQRKWQENDGEN